MTCRFSLDTLRLASKGRRASHLFAARCLVATGSEMAESTRVLLNVKEALTWPEIEGSIVVAH